MRFRKAVCAVLAGAMFFSVSAYARDNTSQFNKFISMTQGPQEGYCDFTLSFAGHEGEYDNVNDYFTGLVSAFYGDFGGGSDDELVTVNTHGLTFYEGGDYAPVYLGPVDIDLIANYGDSFTNIFTVPADGHRYVGIETYGKTANSYILYMYEFNPERDKVSRTVEIYREDNEDGIDEQVWAGGKSYYSHTSGGSLETLINDDKYADCFAAAAAALKNVVPEMHLDEDELKTRMTGGIAGEDFRFYVAGTTLETYIRATGLRFTGTPVVFFDDLSQLVTLRVQPEIVKVVLDGRELEFPQQDPVIVNDRTLVPMRTIFEALGAEVLWDNDTKTVTATTENTTMVMTIGQPSFYVNGEEKVLDVPAQLINDKTLVPIRAISESLGCYVGWDQDAKTVIIQSHI